MCNITTEQISTIFTAVGAIGAIVFAGLQIKDNRKESKRQFALRCLNHYMKLLAEVQWLVRFNEEKDRAHHIEIIRDLYFEADLSLPVEITRLTMNVLSCSVMLEYPTYDYSDVKYKFLEHRIKDIQPPALRIMHAAKMYLSNDLLENEKLRNTYKKYTQNLVC